MLDQAFLYASRPVTYLRNGTVVAENIPAKLGKTLFRAENNYGVTIRIERRDFIVRTSDVPVTPEVGDEILFDGRRYTVTAPNEEPCWKYHTRQSHTQIRIHAEYNGAAKNE